MAGIPGSQFLDEDPGGTYPSGPAPTAVIPGSSAIETLGLRQRTLPAPPCVVFPLHLVQLML